MYKLIVETIESLNSFIIFLTIMYLWTIESIFIFKIPQTVLAEALAFGLIWKSKYVGYSFIKIYKINYENLQNHL